MKWKSICIIVKSIDVSLKGKSYKYTLSTNEESHAINGYNNFAAFVKRVTNSWAEIETPKPIYLNTIKKLSLYSSGGTDTPWIDIEDLRQAIKDNGNPFQLKWGDYDSVFVAFPLRALGNYIVNDMMAATYATMPTLVKTGVWDLEADEGGAYTHEWLHGVCRFFKEYGFNIPEGESHTDPKFNYSKDPKVGWNNFYKDLLTGTIKNQVPPPEIKGGGITKDIWDRGTPLNPGTLIGYGATNQQKFIDAYKSGTIGVPKPYVGNRKAHRWGDGEIQDMQGPKGAFALMKGDDRNCYELPVAYWKKYLEAGGVDALGYPTREVHKWGKGNIQDFETKSGWHGAIMNKDNTTDLFVVKGNIWKAYVATDGVGANSYLGYPTGNEFKWTNPDNKKVYWVQFFENKTYCWAQAFSPWKFGNDKQWANSKSMLEIKDIELPESNHGHCGVNTYFETS
jgi:hypothetical protein